MNYYQIWCNLKDGARDLEFCRNVEAYLGYLQGKQLIEGFQISRRKFGFGPQELGEFNIMISVKDLTQLDNAFNRVATRDDEVEAFHRGVFSLVTTFQSALYRDFPDDVRVNR